MRLLEEFNRVVACLNLDFVRQRTQNPSVRESDSIATV